MSELALRLSRCRAGPRTLLFAAAGAASEPVLPSLTTSYRPDIDQSSRRSDRNAIDITHIDRSTTLIGRQMIWRINFETQICYFDRQTCALYCVCCASIQPGSIT